MPEESYEELDRGLAEMQVGLKKALQSVGDEAAVSMFLADHMGVLNRTVDKNAAEIASILAHFMARVASTARWAGEENNLFGKLFLNGIHVAPAASLIAAIESDTHRLAIVPIEKAADDV